MSHNLSANEFRNTPFNIFMNLHCMFYEVQFQKGCFRLTKEATSTSNINAIKVVLSRVWAIYVTL